MFENILGQQKVKKIISNQVKNDKIAHAYMFIGKDGVGKRLVAIEFAKILNCIVNKFAKIDSINLTSCNKCISCSKIIKNVHPDLHFIDFVKQAELEQNDLEKQKILKIEVIKYMQKKIEMKAYEGRWKIFIIDPAEKMSISASNSLLRMLEEPPKNTIIILIVKYKGAIPWTIVSRSQILFFQPLNNIEILNWLMMNHKMDIVEAKKIAELSEGSISNAVKLVDRNKKINLCLWYKLKNEDLCISDILKLSKIVSKNGANGAIEFIDSMIIEVKKEFRMYPQEKKTIKALELLIASQSLLVKNINSQMVLDNLFFDLFDLVKAYKTNVEQNFFIR
ncbi:MAG: DNA polymerase III subunit [Endomicrobium sp.]|jgi:DNA polymerase-3 subunit delta'|nr:DNA polymerase III subunit [Endomicrobium sp.]